MASEPGSGQAERLHPFFTAARPAPNGGNESASTGDTTTHIPPTEHTFPADEEIPIDPMMLAMDSNAGSSSAMTTAMPAPFPYAVPRPVQSDTMFLNQDTAAYGSYPYQTPYQQQHSQYQQGPAYIQGQYFMPPASAPPGASEPTAQPAATSARTSTTRAPIPIEKNAFSMLQAKKKPVETVIVPAAQETTQTQPEPKRRGRPPKKRRPSISALNNTTAVEASNTAPPSEAISTPLPQKAAQSGLIVKASAPVAPNAPNPLQMMMTKAANPILPVASPAPGPKRLEAKCQYGAPNDPNTARMSHIIGSILEGKHRVFPSTTPPAPAPAQKPAVTAPAAKKAHPLFAAVRSKQSSAKAQIAGGSASKPPIGFASNKQYTSTPCSPKRVRSYQPSATFRTPQFGVSNGILRVPGASLPAWPSRDNVHIRPDDAISFTPSTPQTLPYRKRKGNAIYLRKEENLLAQRLAHLSIASVVEKMRSANGEQFAPPPPELRLPVKHVESGRRLQSRVSSQLRSQHPGLDDLAASISTTLSAFDRYSNEASMWTQKYAPACAREVLQSGDEPLLLKNWLEALKVVAVDTGAGDAADSGKGGSKPKPKKKRRKNKMDGFIVSSDDDEDDDVAEESEDETKWTASGRYGKIKKTAVRSGSLLDKHGRAAARLNNVVVISGPHGSGKSAAVYAVAKELGFEVFEISAGSRRTGKDVTDRIGNMTTNHLVQHKKKKLVAKAPQDVESTSDLEDCDGDDDPDFAATPEPAPCAKQPTMSSFFKPKGPSAAQASSEPKAQPQAAKATAAKPATGEQKQSLILLEEADILYEEDKQFWTTVAGLITQAKRPFVITCTDETLIPLRLLRLHAIFRFSAPPVDPCVDRLLLVAASEGHALKREAAQSLFEARNCDMRASLTDLQFWCQIAVGAKASRFDWFIPRQPAGADQDERGHTTRIVSENTYWPGMGWLNHDVTMCQDGLPDDKEDDFVQQAWHGWQLDMGQWQDSLDLPAWASRLAVRNAASRNERLALLDAYCSFAETMSDADMVSHKVFATGNGIAFDATEPAHPPGGPDEYPIGTSLLDRTTAAHENDHLRLPMATSLRCVAKRILKARVHDTSSAVQQLDHVDAARVLGVIHREHTDAQSLVLGSRSAIARIDFAEAFDPIAVKDTTGYATASSLEPSVFDRNMQPIVVDVAPYVRSIVAHDEGRKKTRQKLTTFLSEAAAASSPGVSSDGELSEGPLPASRRSLKRMRTTRTAMSALEGGSRTVTRNGSWFTADISPLLVMQTAGLGWGHAADMAMAQLRDEAAKADEAARHAAQQAAAAQAAAHAEAQAQAYSAAQAAMVSLSPMGHSYPSIAPYVGQAAPAMAYSPAPPLMSAMPYAPHPPTQAAPYAASYLQAQAAPAYDGQVYGQHGQHGQQYGEVYGQVYPSYGQFQVPGYEHEGSANSQHDAPTQHPPVDPTQQLA